MPSQQRVAIPTPSPATSWSNSSSCARPASSPTRSQTRHCSNCLRHTETDRVPEQRLNGYTIPAYTVCTYCGHSYGFEETA